MNGLGLSSLTKVFRSKDVDKMSENMYATFKNVVDEDFTDYFKNYKKNGMIFGEKKIVQQHLVLERKFMNL